MMVLFFIGVCRHKLEVDCRFLIITITFVESYPDFLCRREIKQAREQAESLSMAVRVPLSYHQVQMANLKHSRQNH